jgi:hypothetical protein
MLSPAGQMEQVLVFVVCEDDAVGVAGEDAGVTGAGAGICVVEATGDDGGLPPEQPH